MRFQQKTLWAHPKSLPASSAPHRWTATSPQLASRLLAEMLIEKERDGGLGQAIVEQVLRV